MIFRMRIPLVQSTAGLYLYSVTLVVTSDEQMGKREDNTFDQRKLLQGVDPMLMG